MRNVYQTTHYVSFDLSTRRRFLIAMVPITSLGCEMKNKPLTLAQASQLTLSVKIEGVSFDVPVTYFFRDFKTGGEWPRPVPQTSGATNRASVDVLKITALLPDFAPYSDRNREEFESTARGAKVDIYLTRRENLEIKSLDVLLPRLKRMPDDERMPRMMKFEDKTSKSDYYLNTLNVGYEMVSIQCIRPDMYSFDIPSPSCVVLVGYRQKFTLKIEFHSQYLSRWDEIVKNTKDLLDKFANSSESRN